MKRNTTHNSIPAPVPVFVINTGGVGVLRGSLGGFVPVGVVVGPSVGSAGVSVGSSVSVGVATGTSVSVGVGSSVSVGVAVGSGVSVGVAVGGFGVFVGVGGQG